MTRQSATALKVLSCKTSPIMAKVKNPLRRKTLTSHCKGPWIWQTTSFWRFGRRKSKIIVLTLTNCCFEFHHQRCFDNIIYTWCGIKREKFILDPHPRLLRRLHQNSKTTIRNKEKPSSCETNCETASFSVRPLALTPIMGKFASACTFPTKEFICSHSRRLHRLQRLPEQNGNIGIQRPGIVSFPNGLSILLKMLSKKQIRISIL